MDLYMQTVWQNYQQKELGLGTSGEVFPKMFMNAQPRRLAHGYETFVHCGRTDASLQRLSEMTDNQVNVNAWSSIGPVEYPRSRDDRWKRHQEASFQNENYQGLYLPSSCIQPPQDDFFRGRAQNCDRGATSYSYGMPGSHQNFSSPLSRESVSINPYQRNAMQAGRATKLDVMLSTPDYEWPYSVTDSSSSYLGGENGLFLPCQALSDPLPQTSLAGPFGLQSRMQFNLRNTPSSSPFSDYSMSTQNEPIPQVPFTAAAQHEHSNQMAWEANSNTGQGPTSMNSLDRGELVNSHCGLPALSSSSPWYLDPLPTADWLTYEPSTISPKDLTLRSTPSTVLSHSRDVFNTSQEASSSEVKTEIIQDSTGPQESIKKPRKRLPGGKPAALPDLAKLPSTNSKKVTKNRAKSPRAISPVLAPASSKLLSHQAPEARILPKRPITITSNMAQSNTAANASLLEPKPCAAESAAPAFLENSAKTQSLISDRSPELASGKITLKRPESRDRFLVAAKLAGMSYKEIRKAGDFSEAESTLRGRFRTLTKDKEARVRRPEWEANDIRLLRKAVRKLTRNREGKEPGQVKVPWKQVADYIANNGGSYHFGNATCRKKWDELQNNTGSQSP